MNKWTLTRALRLSVSLTLVIVTAVIFWHFVSHRRSRPVVPSKTDEIPAAKVERQEGIEHFDFKGDRVIRAKAARHYAGPDGRYYLEGEVEIRDLGKEKDEEVVLFGERVSHDRDWNEILLEGKGKLVYRGLTVESSAFSYEKNKELLTTDRGAVFSSARISGKAQKMAHSFRAGSLLLEGEVEIELREEEKTGPPFLVRGDTVTLWRKKRRGLVEGNASFSFGRSQGHSDTLRFDLTPDEQRVRAVFLEGNAQALIFESQERSAGDSAPVWQKREISAAAIEFRAHKDLNVVQKIEARNDCILKSFAADGGESEIRSVEMKMIFDRREVLREFSAQGAVRLVERGSESEVLRSIFGEEIIMGPKGRTWRVWVSEGGEARLDTPDIDVSARNLVISTLRERLGASGEVKVIVKSRGEQEEAVGFFSGAEPVFGTSDEMSYEEETGRLDLIGAVRMWQGTEILSADKLTALKKSGEIAAEGNIRTVFSRPPKDETATEEKIEVGGAKLNYSPQDKRLSFEQSCWFTSKGVKMNSERIAVVLLENKAEIKEVAAEGKVTITEEFREGKGEKALYYLEQETVVLTGRPTVIDKEKGIIEGDKLTFRLGEGRIQVENKDRERSTTVIKS